MTDEGDRQILPFPISLPLGEGAPVRTLGRMRGNGPGYESGPFNRRGGTLGRPVSMDRREAQGPPLPDSETVAVMP